MCGSERNATSQKLEIIRLIERYTVLPSRLSKGGTEPTQENAKM